MENLICFQQIERNERMLIERKLFTELQIKILKKKLTKKELDANEKTYYYKFIKPKMKAMMTLFNVDEVNIKGIKYIRKDRIEEAKKIIKKLEQKHKNQKIMISGSFLFNETYNDIDIFIFSKYTKEDYKDKQMHITFLSETTIKTLFFSSISQISISNFNYENDSDQKDIDMAQILSTYELLIYEMINKEKPEKLRDFIIQTEYATKKTILNPKELHYVKEKLIRKKSEIISNILINVLILTYNATQIQKTLTQKIKDYEELKKTYKDSKNTQIYVDTYKKALQLAT